MFRADDIAVTHSGPSISLLSVSVKACGAIGDDTADDTAAFASAIAKANAIGQDVYLPFGTYKLVTRGGAVPRCLTIPASTVGFGMVGSNATIHFDSSVGNGIVAETGCTRLHFDSVCFLGYSGVGFDDFSINLGASIYVVAGCSELSVDRCRFQSVQAVFCASDDASDRHTEIFNFTRNRLFDSPVSIAGGPSEVKITDNFFINATPVLTQSHAIYFFGNVEHGTISGNTFRNHGDATIEIRATTTRRGQKRDYIIQGNRFYNETSYAMFISTLSSEANMGTLSISGNTLTNTGGIALYGVKDSVVDANVFVWDYECTSINNSGVSLSGGALGGGMICVPDGVTLSKNRMVNRHPFLGIVDIVAEPADGDQVTVGAVVYTWRTNPVTSGEVRLDATLRTCAKNLANEIRGYGLTPTNVILRDLTDVWYTTTGLEHKMWLSSYKTFALSRTGTALNITSTVDRNNVLLWGINVNTAIAPKLIDNDITNGQISISSCARPLIRGGTILPGTAATGITSLFNAFPVYDGVEISFDRSLTVAELSSRAQIMSYDAFPVIKNMPLHVNQYVNSTTLLLPWLQGASGNVPIGDGAAKMYIYYGFESGTIGDPAARAFQWADGDVVELFNAGTNTTYLFTFKRAAPNGTSEFNSYATLLALINNHTAGSWVATNPVLVAGGADTFACGYIEIKAGAVGANRNHDTLTTLQNNTTRKGSLTCAVYLRPWAANGVYAGSIYPTFSGGAPTATKTVIYTPLASINQPLIVQGVDAASQALAPIAYQADTIPGVSYTITHLAAVTGTEKFFYAL